MLQEYMQEPKKYFTKKWKSLFKVIIQEGLYNCEPLG